jgi:hypothetical protein
MDGWHIERQAVPAEKLSYNVALHLIKHSRLSYPTSLSK